mgnify:CR=1 FL=1
MRSARLLICTLALAGGLALAVPLVLRAVHQLRVLRVPTPALPTTGRPAHQAAPPSAANNHMSRTRTATAKAPVGHPVLAPTHQRDGTSLWLLRLIGLEIAGGWVLIWLAAIGLVACRTRRRRTRVYALYELHLSTHDQAKGQDLEDMVESIANIVRAWPADRARHGQPYFALELICGGSEQPGGGKEMEWSINVRCQPEAVTALDGAISAAYPDVRLGRTHGEQPRQRGGVLREPGYVMRFRKERSFVYSLIADGEEQASSPLEQIARAQVAQGAPSIVRFQLTPTPSFFEELARRLYRRHENKLVRQERFGLPEGGLLSTFNRAEMRAAERTQNRSLFWLETAVAADNREVCKAVAAAVQSRRGENRLHRRWMIIRQNLYRRRFPRALGPPIPSFRTLVSAAEVAHLLELPSARMKGVPVRRVTIPRIPAPPEVARGSRARRTRPGGPEARPPVCDGPASIRASAGGSPIVRRTP